MDSTQDEKIITYYQDSDQLGDDRVSKHIMNIFFKYSNRSEQLEELKNSISNERDHHDLVELLDGIAQPYRDILKKFFRDNPVHPNSKYAVKLMVDIDNTTIENSSIAPIVYIDKELIPGIKSLLKYFSYYGSSSVSFLSARPRLIEKFSIDKIDSKLSKQLRFSFLTGTVYPIFDYLKGWVTSNEKHYESSYQKMGKEKFDNYVKLRAVYPSNRFIFLGDNTQGDPYFAHELVNQDRSFWAAIRIVGDRKFPDNISNHPRIFWHSSYFELGWKLIQAGLANDILAKLLIGEFNQIYDADNYDRFQVSTDQYYVRLLGHNNHYIESF